MFFAISKTIEWLFSYKFSLKTVFDFKPAFVLLFVLFQDTTKYAISFCI